MRGGYNPQATEVWQETLRIPPVKVYDAGSLRKDVWDLIFANVRLDMVAEDMRAEIGSLRGGRARHPQASSSATAARSSRPTRSTSSTPPSR